VLANPISLIYLYLYIIYYIYLSQYALLSTFLSVLQLLGEKEWTVYDPISVMLPRADNVFHMQRDQLLAGPAPAQPQVFRLSEGDVAYIPRGAAHEAVAVRLASAGGQVGLGAGDVSMHLTIGLETATHGTVEVG
jgi:hypothetical protein